MEYILKEFLSYKKLKETADFLFRENENLDNKFYLVQTKYGTLGFTYYHLGIKPSIILRNDILFMGFGTSIIIYNIFQKNLLYKITDTMHIVYELQYNSYFEYIVCICELCILTFNSKGKLLWENGVQDPIYDYKIKEKSVEIQFEDKTILSLSLDNGGVVFFKK